MPSPFSELFFFLKKEIGSYRLGSCHLQDAVCLKKITRDFFFHILKENKGEMHCSYVIYFVQVLTNPRDLKFLKANYRKARQHSAFGEP